MISNLEALVPGLAELRRRERLNRADAFLGLTHTLAGVECLAMTPMHRLTLQRLENALICSAVDPLEGDVFTFLWVLSPRYSRRLTLASRVRQLLLARKVRRIEKAGKLGIAIAEIRAYIIAQFQDRAEGSFGEDSLDQSAWVHWAATDASWWMASHGFTLASYLSTPYPVLQQLYRGWRVNNPSVDYDERGKASLNEPLFVNESDRLVGQWQRGMRAAATAQILAQTHRLP